MNQEKERRIGEGIDGAAARQQEQSFPTFLVELTVKSRSPLTSVRGRTDGVQGNQIHSSNLWTLGILKMYMGALDYKGKTSFLKL